MQENIKKENIKKDSKMNFLKKILISIKDFDKYDIFLNETIKQSLLYLVFMVVVFTIVVTVLSTITFITELESAVKWFDSNINNISYQDNIVSVNENNKVETNELGKLFGKVIIDTSELSDEQIKNYKDNINDTSNAIVFLKNKILMKNNKLTSIVELDYNTFLKSYNIENLNKQTILDSYKNNKFNIYFTNSLEMFFYMFIIYFISALADVFILAVLTFIITRIFKMKIKFIQSINISIHALTLPIILNIIYVIINAITGFVIQYFQIMYTAIAFIYIITAILMIKSDYIKRTVEVKKIEEEQNNINEQYKKEKEDVKSKEKKEEEDSKKDTKDGENSKKKDKKDKKEPEINNRPEGNNA